MISIAASIALTAPATAQSLAGGFSHTLVAKPDGTVWSFGYNGFGSLGDGTNTNSATPVQVTGLTDVVAVAAGNYQSLAITSTGDLYVWGGNASGELGLGNTTSRNTPAQSTLTNVVAIAAGRYHSLALRSNGDAYAFGYNLYGQLGNANNTNQTSPVLVATGVAAIAAGDYHSIFVKTDGSVYGTGNNANGQLGDTTATSTNTAVQMSGITTATAAAAGSAFTIVLLSDGTLKSTGVNSTGSLGDGTWTPRYAPVSVLNLTSITAISAGSYHGLARKSDGSLYAWGGNGSSQLGLGDTTNRHTPAAVSSLSGIVAIDAGADHSIAASSTGIVSTWGYNNIGQLGDGTHITRTTPNAISDEDYVWKLMAPTFNVAAGTYNTDQTVTLSAMSGSTVHYTRNGVDPTTSDPSVSAGSTVSVTYSQTLKAKAFKTGFAASVTASAAYVMKVGAIGYSPGPATYTSAQNVTLSTVTPGATIRYTTDGSTPTASSTAYTGAINIATLTVLKAAGFKTDWSDSDVSSGTYTMNFGTLTAPTADQATGDYVASVTVALSSSMSGTTIRYTTNNTAVQANSDIYTTPLTFDATTTLRFKGFHPDYTASAEVTRTYTLAPAPPTFNPTAGSYTAGQDVTITAPTAGSTIHYTINGVEPTTSDPAISSGSTIVVGNFTLKAKAWKTGNSPSATTTAAYTVSGEVTPPALAAGNTHSLAIRSDGVAFGWGENSTAQLGLGATSGSQLLPQVISGLTGGVAVDAGSTFSHALLNTGTLAAFGDNTNGRLGIGSTVGSLLPAAISGLSGVVRVSNGGTHALALKGDGSIFAWGKNDYGQLAESTSTTHRTSPTEITSVTGVSAIAAGDDFSLALKTDGTIKSWGRNSAGSLGNNSTTDSSTPVSVSSISTATAISAGPGHALALLADGSVRAWGNNTWGQIGDGYSGWSNNRSTPVTVTGLSDVIAIGAGATFSVALKDDGSVWTWGDNSAGELGDGTGVDRHAAAQLTSLSDIVKIAVGANHALAMTADATVYAWGRNTEGQLGDGTTTNRFAPVLISGPGMAWKIATPSISLASGLYATDQTATISISDPTATIRYTTNGADPTSTDATVTSGGTLNITESQTLKVSGWKTGHVTSLVVARTYELKAATPSLTPGAGAYGSAQTVSMSTTTSAATIRYTTDGTEPTSSSTAYSSAIAVSDTQTVKAKAFKSGWTTSDSGYASYSISGGTVATPSITPSGGAQTSPPLVAITTSTTGATIRYTLDGSTPTGASPVFLYPFVVHATTTVKAKAFKAGYTSSAVASVTYDVDASGAAATPLISPAGGWFATQQTVTITGPSGATLRYTTDGTDPTTSSTSITSGNTITVDKSQIVKVRAWASGVDPSAVRRADFVITGAVAGGFVHSFGLLSSGVLKAWGGDSFGQHGSGGSTTPVQVLTNVTAVAAGVLHSLAVKQDGSLWGWGDGNSGKIAGSTTSTPTQITFSGAVAVAGGWMHSLILKSDGTVWALAARGENGFSDVDVHDGGIGDRAAFEG